MVHDNRIPELDKLFEDVGTYRKSAEYRNLLDFIKRFPKMAPYNAMLVHIQKPGSQFVASAHDWKVKYGRRPKVGARPLVILRPFGPVAFVFELNDTEGAPFPEALLEPFKAEGNITENKLEDFKSSLLYEGVTVVEQDYGTSMAGFVGPIEETFKYKTMNKSELFYVFFSIVVNRNLKPSEKMATLFHELGHVFCGHVYQPKAKWLPQRCFLSKNEKEFEAESVSWLLCERLGIVNPSSKYLSGYLDSNEEIPSISIDLVLKTVGLIESIMSGRKTLRKELLVKKS
mgnify:CR=1 FL=1